MDQNIKMRRCSKHLTLTVTFYLLGLLIPALTLPTTQPPLMDGHPFVVIWNAPTSVCKKLEIHLDTSTFAAVTTPEDIPGQFLTLFYEKQLGLYPYVDPVTEQEYNGGIPQKGNLTANLMKASLDIPRIMPSDSIPGLAVIDWEAWRPMWDRNWGSKDIYRQLSISYAKELNPTLPPNQVTPTAKRQFQTAARNYMQETMMLGKNLRSNQLWGFYLFPDCYNYGWEEPGYTGTCPEKTQKLNDELLWLWESSTALYPSIYLSLSQSNSPNVAYFVRNRVQEAVRVASLPERPYTVPIYVYSRPLYRDQNQLFLSEEDLIGSVGESAALGASGVVMWGATKDYNSKSSCEALSTYLPSTLNTYIANVTAATKLCSDVLCQSNGRCVRKNYNSPDYLHLNPDSFQILKLEGKYMAVGLPSSADLDFLADKFTCQCYTELILRDSFQACLFVRHRIQEAMRVSMLPNQTYSIPIYAYICSVYKDSINDYMSEYDLVNMVGEAAALGAAEVISWGDMKVTEQHLDMTMNPYILNISMATRLCSEALCQANGRCVRKIWDRDDYLHLDPQRYQIKRYRSGEMAVKGEISKEDVDWFADRFECLYRTRVSTPTTQMFSY